MDGRHTEVEWAGESWQGSEHFTRLRILRSGDGELAFGGGGGGGGGGEAEEEQGARGGV